MNANEINVISAITAISLVFNTTMAVIIYILSKQFKSEIKLGYTSLFLIVIVLRNLNLFLFSTQNQNIFLFFSESLSLLGSFILVSVIYPILTKKISSKLILSSFVLVLVIFVSLLLTGVSFFWKVLPSSIFNSFAFAIFGFIIFNLKEYQRAFRIFFLMICMLLAIQRFTFPFLYALEWYRPYGFTINTLFMFLFGVGCILISFNIQTEKLNLSLEELESLQKSIKDVNVRLLIMNNQLPAIIYNIEFLPEPRASYISPKMEEITGYNINYFYSRIDFFKEIVIPEDQEKIEQLYLGESPVVLRMKHANGSIIWTQHFVNVSYDILGIERRIDAVALDITNSIKTEISLKQEKNLNSTVFDNAANLILLTNAKGIIEDINEAALKILGLEKYLAVGNYIQKVILIPEDQEFLTEVLDDINEIQNIAESLILRCVSKNQRVLFLEWRLGIIRDSKNDPTKLIWIGIDQTSKRTAELELKELNRSLEEKVTERTRELQASNIDLNSALYALRETQQKLIQSEKLVSLGQLVSGLSHEINNPIGMIKSSFETLVSEWQELSYDDSTILINDLLDHLLESEVSGLKIVTGLTNRQIRKSLKDRFNENEILFEEELAELFADSGIRNISIQNLEKLKRTINHWNDFLILKRLLTVRQASEHIFSSVNRLSKITYTLKNFAGLQSSLDLSDFSLSDTIHSAVTLYKDHFLRDINLILNLDYNGKVRCIQGDLVQLWSQLIWNSIQAVATKGTVHIRSFKGPDSIIVEIEDTGPGIPAAYHAKIFMPFFSTKTSGDGLGLGLYLVKEIANRHNAVVDFESNLGRTVFRVRFLQTA